MTFRTRKGEASIYLRLASPFYVPLGTPAPPAPPAERLQFAELFTIAVAPVAGPT
jgi:hypothetical protein